MKKELKNGFMQFGNVVFHPETLISFFVNESGHSEFILINPDRILISEGSSGFKECAEHMKLERTPEEKLAEIHAILTQ